MKNSARRGSMGYPVHASQGAQHSTPLLCTVLSDTSPPHEGAVALGENHG